MRKMRIWYILILAVSAVGTVPGAISDPGEIPGLYLQLEADFLGLSDGATVTSWADSVNGYVFTGTASYNASYANGHAAVRFNGINNGLVHRALIAAPSTANLTLFVAGNFTTAVNDSVADYLISAQYPGSTSGNRLRILKGAGDAKIDVACGASGAVTDVAASDTQQHVFAIVSGQTSNTVQFFIDGASVRSFNSGTNALALQALGLGFYHRTGDQFGGCSIAEVLLYDHALTSTEVSDVAVYLQEKYNPAPITTPQYINPINVRIADPAVLRTSTGTHRYYLTGTGSVTAAERYVSNDLVNWRRKGRYIDLGYYRDRGNLYSSNMWAAELAEKDGHFYYYFTVPTEDSRRAIYVAHASSPDDDFVPLPFPAAGEAWTPVLLQSDSIIDPHVFIDDDGSPYLFFNKDIGQLRVVRLLSNMYQTTGSVVNIFSASQSWENYWMEGAAVIQRNGLYYLTWSSNYYGGNKYSVGYATATAPMGPYTKASASSSPPLNPILQQWLTYPGYPYEDDPATDNPDRIDPMNIGYSGPGHHSFVLSPDGTETFICYHTKLGTAFNGSRQMCLDRIGFTSAGHLYVDAPGNTAPTRTARPYPSGAPYPYTAKTGEFNGTTLNADRWLSVWREDESLWSVSGGNLNVTMTTGTNFDVNGASARNIFLQKAPRGDWTITTKVTVPSSGNNPRVYIIAMQNTNNYVLFLARPQSSPAVQPMREIKGNRTAPEYSLTFPGTFYLQIRKTCGYYYQCYYSANGSTWTPYGDHYYADLKDIYVGLAAYNDGSARQVRFDYFDIQLSADLDQNGLIDINDFSALSGQWLNEGCFPKSDADITNNCMVDVSDLADLAAQWLTSCPCRQP